MHVMRSSGVHPAAKCVRECVLCPMCLDVTGQNDRKDRTIAENVCEPLNIVMRTRPCDVDAVVSNDDDDVNLIPKIHAQKAPQS